MAEKIVGVNCYTEDNEQTEQPQPYRPDPSTMKAHVEKFKLFKSSRDKNKLEEALHSLRESANDINQNIFEKVIEASAADATHGEIIGILREELGFGHPMIVA